MTKKQKEKKIAEIKTILENNNFQLDSYGNYIFKTNTHIFRMKIKKINARFEVKQNQPNSIWYVIFSFPITKIKIENLDSYLKRRIK